MKTLIEKDLDKFTTTKLLMRKEAKDFYEAARYLNKETEVRWKKQMEPPPSPPLTQLPGSGNPVSFQP